MTSLNAIMTYRGGKHVLKESLAELTWAPLRCGFRKMYPTISPVFLQSMLQTIF